VIAGSIPDEHDTTLRALGPQVFYKGDGRLRIALLIGFEAKLLSREVEGTKVGLLLALVGYRDFDTLLSFTPDLATDVSPQQVALI